MGVVFGDFVLDEARRELTRGGRPVELQRLPFEVLLYLVEHRDRAVSNEELLAHVWRGTRVSRGAVAQAMLQLRRALGDDARNPEIVRTVRGHGFRFCAAVRPVGGASLEPEPPPAGVAHVRGRDAELAWLRASFDEAAAGRGSVVLIGGEPGIGKTTLLEAAAAQLGARGALVVWGRSSEDRSGVPFFPWASVAQALIGSSRTRERALALTSERNALLSLFPSLHPRSAVAKAGLVARVANSETRARAFAAVDSLLAAIAELVPTVVLLDDWHAADVPSQLLLAFLAPKLKDRAVLVIAAHRDIDPSDESRALRDAIDARARLSLRGLSREASGALLEERRGEAPSAALLDRVMQLTGGSPFLLAEVARVLAMRDARDLPEDLEAAFRVPDRGLAVARRALAGFDGPARAALEACAVLGRELEIDLAAQLLAQTPAELRVTLAPAEERGSIERRGSDRIAFAHALIWQALHDAIEPARAKDLHLRAARALEARLADDPDLARDVANHLARSGVPEAAARAASYWMSAGERAMAQLAFEEAASLFARAGSSFDAEGDARARIAVLRRGEALRCAGRLKDAIECFERSSELARAASDWPALAEAAIGYGQTQKGFGDARLIGLLQEALAHDDALDLVRRARILAELGFALRQLEQEAAFQVVAQAVALAEQSGDPRTLARALVAWRWNVRGSELAPALLEVSTRAVELAERAGDLGLALDAMTWRAGDLLENGEVSAFDRELERHAQTAEQLGQPYHQLVALRFTAVQHLLRGRFALAEAAADRAREEGHAIGEETAEVVYWIELVPIRRELGRIVEVEPFARAILAAVPSLVWRAFLGLILAWTGRAEEARVELSAALSGLHTVASGFNWMVTLAFLAELASIVGAEDEARLLYERLLPHADHHVCVAGGSLYWGPVRRYLGLALAASGRLDDAAAMLTEALDATERLGTPHWEARVALDLARVEARRARIESAAAFARRAAGAAERLELSQVRDEARELLASV
ncbi:MAG: AAA family ATPase [Sandaracinaceae bacterium]|nr:AAA family ATPase [Sandaracinaceae bacterium]